MRTQNRITAEFTRSMNMFPPPTIEFIYVCDHCDQTVAHVFTVTDPTGYEWAICANCNNELETL